MGRGTGGAVILNVGKNNAEKEGASAIVQFRRLVNTLRGTDWQIVLSGITSNGRQGSVVWEL